MMAKAQMGFSDLDPCFVIQKRNHRQLAIDVIFTHTFRASCCLAVAAGFKYGLQSGKQLCPQVGLWPGHEVVFVDNDYKKYRHTTHLGVVRDTHPKYATVRDIMTKDQCQQAGIDFFEFDQIMDYAQEIEQYAENVIVIPKYDCLDAIPDRFMLGYSVPTSHGGTPLPVEAFRGRRIHLLGGSWKEQLAHIARLEGSVVSVDNNYLSMIAQKGGAVLPNGDRFDLAAYRINTRVNPQYIALAISLGNVGQAINEFSSSTV